MNQTENNVDSSKDKSELFTNVYPSDIWKGLIKFWWVCVILAIIGGSYKFYKSYIRFTPVYSTSATFTVTTQSSAIADGGFTSYSFYYDTTTATQLSKTFPYVMSSNLLQDAICEDLQISSVPVSLSASSVTGSNMFTLSASGSDPQMTYDVLLSAIKNYPSVAAYIVGNIELTSITEPYVPQTPVNSSQYKKDTAIGAGVGFALGALWIFFYALIRKTIRKKEDIRTELRSDVIGTLPQVTFKKYRKRINTTILSNNERIGSGFLESLRVLRNTFVNSLDSDDKVVMITSTAPGEGKTTVIANLALSLSDLGKNTLLIDCDLRNPSIAPIFDMENAAKQKVEESDIYVINYLEDFKVSVMSFKEEDKRYWKIMRSNLIKGVIESVRNKYDYILVDTPPCGLVSDALVVAQASDCALYVILQDTVRVARIADSLSSLMETDVKVKGCILNGALSGLSGYGDNYGYGYGYGYRAYGRYGYGYGRYGRYGYGYGYGDKKDKKNRH